MADTDPSYTVHYHPPAYGDVIPQRECRHDPAGHRMELGLQILPVNPKRPNGRRYIAIDGQFCMKCGWCWHVDVTGSRNVPDEPGSADWWDIYQIAREEFGGKCWQFASRLSQLGEEVGHLSRLLGLPQCRSQTNAQHALKLCRHHGLLRRGKPQKRDALRFRVRRVRWQQWPGLYPRAA